MLLINSVYDNNDELFRILKIINKEVIWININSSSSWPSSILEDDLIEAIVNKQVIKVDDPFSYLEALDPKVGSIAREKRDYNYKIIKPIIENSNSHIPKIRAELIKNAIKENKTSKVTLYRLVRIFWQRGKRINGLIPDYQNSGGKGIKRDKANKKLGRL